MDGFYTTAGIVGIAMMIRMGPVDATRSIYNAAVGDTPVLKQQLLTYCREGIKGKYKGTDQDAERLLARDIGVQYANKINPDDVSIESLWAEAEKYPKSDLDYWLWTDVGEQNIAPKLEKLEKWISSCCTEKDINKDKK